MAKHGVRGSGSGQSRKHGRPWATTAVVIGGTGMVLAAPAAALLISPAVAQAAPPPVVDPLCPLVGSCAGGSLGASIAGVVGPAGLVDPFGSPTDLLGFAGGIPILNIFIGNGADGTALHPDGFNGGLFFGNGGKGFTPTAVGATGGNGGAAGLLFGSGGSGGNGAAGDTVTAGGSGGNGGAASLFIGNGGSGGAGGTGAAGVNPTTTSTAAAGTPPSGNGADGVGLQNGGNGADGQTTVSPFGIVGGNGGNAGDLGGN